MRSRVSVIFAVGLVGALVLCLLRGENSLAGIIIGGMLTYMTPNRRPPEVNP